ncbi:MAG: radical SAM protein [Planctomycetes bacterium]|nr:radical SAM protein [Planctomycetota bacterium]
MNTGAGQYVYGPVPSRRLGRSLGIDLVPFKTCSYDCIYCQLGRTTNQTTARQEYVPVEDVLEELDRSRHVEPRPDFIGIAGSGEPTLHARIGDIIAGIKRRTATPVAVLTNGSLLWLPEVRAAIAEADLVMPSLDAGTAPTFARVNRPHPDIPFEKMVEGLVAFREEFPREIWLEVFVLSGITDRPEEIARIAAIVRRVRPDRVQLNTVARPAGADDARAVSAERLEALRGEFPGVCEVIAETHLAPAVHSVAGREIEQEILALLKRRPCTVEGIAQGLALPPNAVVKHLDALLAGGSVRLERREGTVFYEGVQEE